jgi:hypothetical protein
VALVWTILIAFWGLPLLFTMVCGLACLLSERLRLSAARVLGLIADPTSSPSARNNAAPARISGGGEFQGERNPS